LNRCVQLGLVAEENTIGQAGSVGDLGFKVHVGSHDVTRADVAKLVRWERGLEEEEGDVVGAIGRGVDGVVGAGKDLLDVR